MAAAETSIGMYPDALTKWQEGDFFDVILMDVQMPDMTVQKA